VTGINMELLGQRNTDQSGVLDAQRKQSGMTILASLFDANANYLKQIGRIRLYFIQTYLADGRLMRITHGNGGYKAIRLLKDKVAGEYDVEVADAPTAPDIKDQTWKMLMELMPFFKGSMTPTIAGIFLDASPLPSKTVADLKQAMQTPQPMQIEAHQTQQQQIQAKTQHMAAQAEAARASAQASLASAKRNEAAAARDMGMAILDIAQAGGHAVQAQADATANAAYQQLMTIFGSAGGGQSGTDMAPPQPPQGGLPTLPVMGAGGNLSPAAIQQLVAHLQSQGMLGSAPQPQTMQ